MWLQCSSSSSNSHLLHWHASAEDGSHGEVASMTGIACSHHVLCIKHLLRQFGNCQRSVLLATTRRQRSEAWHEEMQAREWHHVDGQLAQIRVQLPHTGNTTQPLSAIDNWRQYWEQLTEVLLNKNHCHKHKNKWDSSNKLANNCTWRVQLYRHMVATSFVISVTVHTHC